ncbi:MAG: UPF0158 family protein [Polyangiales bacterium]
MTEKPTHPGTLREVPIAWESLEDAFENNAPEVHSYLNLETGDVVRIVDGIAEPSTHARIAADPGYLRVDPVSSREQYRWMERFIVTIEESELRKKLVGAIDGKGAFRRFKDVLMAFPIDRERWFAFRSERLRIAIESWLEAHGLHAQEREQWQVPTAEQIKAQVEQQEKAQPVRKTRAALAESSRQRLHELCDLLAVRELDLALEFLEFLRERRPLPRARARSAGVPDTDDGEESSE